MTMLYHEASDVVLAHLRAYRDHLDSLIKCLEEIKEWRNKNTYVAAGAAPPVALGTFKIGTIGDEPLPPPVPTVKIDLASAPGLASHLVGFAGLPEKDHPR